MRFSRRAADGALTGASGRPYIRYSFLLMFILETSAQRYTRRALNVVIYCGQSLLGERDNCIRICCFKCTDAHDARFNCDAPRTIAHSAEHYMRKRVSRRLHLLRISMF